MRVAAKAFLAFLKQAASCRGLEVPKRILSYNYAKISDTFSHPLGLEDEMRGQVFVTLQHNKSWRVCHPKKPNPTPLVSVQCPRVSFSPLVLCLVLSASFSHSCLLLSGWFRRRALSEHGLLPTIHRQDGQTRSLSWFSFLGNTFSLGLALICIAC